MFELRGTTVPDTRALYPHPVAGHAYLPFQAITHYTRTVKGGDEQSKTLISEYLFSLLLYDIRSVIFTYTCRPPNPIPHV